MGRAADQSQSTGIDHVAAIQTIHIPCALWFDDFLDRASDAAAQHHVPHTVDLFKIHTIFTAKVTHALPHIGFECFEHTADKNLLAFAWLIDKHTFGFTYDFITCSRPMFS